MQVIEKVKVVPEGYNGAGMDGYGRRDVNGKANAGLTLGIIGTALGAWALFGNRRSAGVLGTGAGLMGDGSTNINVVGAGMGSAGAPTAFQAWSKSCMVVYRADLLKLLVLLLHNITNQLKNKLCYLLIKLYWAEQTLC